MIVPPATLGILGGGQLGRYFVMAARTMGYGTVVLEPDPHAPAGAVADRHLVAPYTDAAALAELADRCAVVTTEFENAPAVAMRWLAAHTAVHPNADAVAITQDRRAEKHFAAALGLAVAPFAVIDSAEDIPAAALTITFPAILKTAHLGYDGKGQVGVANADRLDSAWHSLGHVPCVLEQRLALRRELSVVLARNESGTAACYPPVVNDHCDGILDCTTVAGGDISDSNAEATSIATAIADALDYVGVLAVELFDVGGSLLVNELAPRPHNSGHWTLDAAATSQFEQQVRAICGLTPGSTAATSPAAMVNLLGDLWAHGEPDWARVLAEPGAHLHLYGKRQARPGRKMGHLTVTAATATEAEQLARSLRAAATAR